MSMNLPVVQPKFVKEMQGAGVNQGIRQSFVNIDDIANLRQINDNYWEADSLSHQKNLDGTDTTYHFDNIGATRIINYLA